MIQLFEKQLQQLQLQLEQDKKVDQREEVVGSSTQDEVQIIDHSSDSWNFSASKVEGSLNPVWFDRGIDLDEIEQKSSYRGRRKITSLILDDPV